ncbi:hypothetical protein EST38_g13508, partial [Candolleomyces aberdarensis]
TPKPPTPIPEPPTPTLKPPAPSDGLRPIAREPSASPEEPIERLPDDILREIFLHCLPDLRSDITLLSKTAPVLLTHVCRHWRNVAIEFGVLWKWIQVYLPDPPLQEDVMQTLVRSFERAKIAPFKLQVIHPTDIGTDNYIDRIQDDLIDRIVVPIGQSLTRLTLVRIRPCQLLTITSSQFPSLERLVLFFEECDMFDWQEWDEHGPIRAFQDVPTLRYVAVKELFMMGDNKDQPNIEFPASTLTHFVLGITGGRGVPSNFVAKYFAPKCKNVVSLHLMLDDNDKGFEGAKVPPNSLELASVESLTIDYHWGVTDSLWTYPSLFDGLYLPNLRRLRFDGEHIYLNRWSDAETNRYLNKLSSFDKLEYLYFRCAHYNVDAKLDRILKRVEKVTTLHVELYDFIVLLEMLILPTSGDSAPRDVLLPLLDTLVLHIFPRYPPDPFQWISNTSTPFMKFLISRVPGCFRRLIFCGFENETVKQKMDKKLRAGLGEYFIIHGDQRQFDFETCYHIDNYECGPDIYDWVEARPILRRVYDYRGG